MDQDAGICFDPGPLGLPEIQQRVRDMWADLGFDDAALAGLRRDGLNLDSVRLRGPCPYRIDRPDGGTMRVHVYDGTPVATLLDLWRMHFAKGLRPDSLAA